jgi:hypothetical protein
VCLVRVPRHTGVPHLLQLKWPTVAAELQAAVQLAPFSNRCGGCRAVHSNLGLPQGARGLMPATRLLLLRLLARSRSLHPPALNRTPQGDPAAVC